MNRMKSRKALVLAMVIVSVLSVFVGFTGVTWAAPPGSVAGIGGKAAGPGIVRVWWTANAESNLSYYNVYRSTTSGFTPSAGNKIGTSSLPQYDDSTVSQDTTYYYKVKAVNTLNEEGGASAEFSKYTGMSWSFDSGLQGWTAAWNLSSLTASNGKLVAAANGPIATVYSPALTLDASKVKSIRVRASNGTTANNLQVYWKTSADPVYDDFKYTNVPTVVSQASSSYVDYILDVGSVSTWTGTITQIRLGFSSANTGSTFYFDEVELSPQLSGSTVYTDSNNTLIIDADKAIDTSSYASWSLKPEEFFVGTGVAADWRLFGSTAVYVPHNASGPYSVSFKSKIVNAGTYKLWVRAHGGGGTFVVNVNGTNSTNTLGNSQFQWYDAGTYSLAAGNLSLSVSMAAGEAHYIDAFALSTDTAYDPKKIGPLVARDKGNAYYFVNESNSGSGGLSAEYSSSPTGRMTYRWLGLGSVLTGKVPSVTFTSAGTFPITLEVTDATGEHAYISQSVVKVDNPPTGLTTVNRLSDAARSAQQLFSTRFGLLNAGDTSPGYLMEYSYRGIDVFNNAGTKLWSYNTPAPYVPSVARDVGGLIWDIDGDNAAEVIHWRNDAGTEKLVIASGSTGAIERQADWPMAGGQLNNKLAIANFTGGDNATNIVVLSGDLSNNKITAYDNQLNVLWQQTYNGLHDAYGHYVYIRDVNGDGRDEVIVSGRCYNYDGTLRWSIPAIVNNVEHMESIAFGDLNNDGKEDLVAAVGLRGVYAVEADTGSILWTRTFPYNIQYAAVGKIQKEKPGLQVVIGERQYINYYIKDWSVTEDESNQSRLYLLDKDGNTIWGGGAFNSGREKKPVVADVTNDGIAEIFAGDTRVDRSGVYTRYFTDTGAFHALDFDSDGREELILQSALSGPLGGIRVVNFPDTPLTLDKKLLQYKYVNHSNYGP